MFYYKLKIIYLTYWLLFFYKTNENYNNILQYKEIKIILIRTRKKNDDTIALLCGRIEHEVIL